jgi:hypothetical protein
MLGENDIFRFEVFALGERIKAQLASHTDTVTGLITDKMIALVNSGELTRMVSDAVESNFKSAVDNAVQEYFKYGDGRLVVEEMVKKSLKRRPTAADLFLEK